MPILEDRRVALAGLVEQPADTVGDLDLVLADAIWQWRGSPFGVIRSTWTLAKRFEFLSAGAWYCPRHGLLVTAKALLGLYQVEGDADWSEICAVIREVLPEVIHKVEAGEIGAARLDPAPRRR